MCTVQGIGGNPVQIAKEMCLEGFPKEYEGKGQSLAGGWKEETKMEWTLRELFSHSVCCIFEIKKRLSPRSKQLFFGDGGAKTSK